VGLDMNGFNTFYPDHMMGRWGSSIICGIMSGMFHERTMGCLAYRGLLSFRKLDQHSEAVYLSGVLIRTLLFCIFFLTFSLSPIHWSLCGHISLWFMRLIKKLQTHDDSLHMLRSIFIYVDTWGFRLQCAESSLAHYR
jgi:hypothetical protein